MGVVGDIEFSLILDCGGSVVVEEARRIAPTSVDRPSRGCDLRVGLDPRCRYVRHEAPAVLRCAGSFLGEAA